MKKLFDVLFLKMSIILEIKNLIKAKTSTKNADDPFRVNTNFYFVICFTGPVFLTSTCFKFIVLTIAQNTLISKETILWNKAVLDGKVSYNIVPER